jgi:acyl-CoA dehydrogenase
MAEQSSAFYAAVSEREQSLNEVREAARTLAKKFDLAYWRECDRTASYPWDFVKTFAKAGWMGIMMPEEYGGMGLGLTEAAVMLQEVAACGGMAGASAIHFYIFPPAPMIHRPRRNSHGVRGHRTHGRRGHVAHSHPRREEG